MREHHFKFKIYFSLFLLCIYFIFIKSECTEDHTRLTYFTIYCSSQPMSDKSHIELLVDQEVRIVIKCHNISTYNEFETLMPRKINLGNFLKVQIFDCPLAPNRSMGKMLQNLKIQNYKKLEYVNNIMSSNITKENLQDLSESLQQLVLELKSVMQLKAELFTDKSLRQLKHLYLYGLINELYPESFENLPNLVTLHLESNLYLMPHNLLKNSHHLKSLTLAGNQFVKEPLYLTAPALLYLIINNNNITNLTFDSFQQLPNVKSIKLENNLISSLPEGLLDSNKHLEIFSLVENNGILKQLPNSLFANLTNLQEIKIKCNLENVPFDLFSFSLNLNKIILSYNKLEYLPEELFRYQKSLTYLDLSYNSLRNLSDRLFENLENLIELRLAGNKLKNVDIGSHLFLPLRRLQLLDLNSNQLTSLITMPFDGNLETLNMRNNSLTSMFSIQNNVSSTLKHLDLSYNLIENIKSKNLELIFAKHLNLDLSYNRIKSINLSQYGTRTIPNGRVLQVNINFNPIKCDCFLMDFIKYLANEKPSLRFKVERLKCQTTDRPVKNMQLKDLLCLETQQCPVDCNNCWRRPWDKTLIVNCTKCSLKKLPELPDLRQVALNYMEVFLDNNQINELPSGKSMGYNRVTVLNVANNSLTSVSSAQLPINLQTLNIKNNLLVSLNPQEMLISLKQLKNVTLADNPFKCHCDNMAFWHLIHNYSHIFVDYSNMTCMTSNLERINVFKFYELCPHKAHISIISLAIISSIILLAFVLYYKYKDEFKVWLYAHKWFQCLVAHYDLNDDDKFYDAFLAYSPQDEIFVLEHLVPGLEANPAISYELCIPSRDWLIGDCIPDQIVQAIDNSKRTLFVLSPSFIRYVWSKLEFKYAHQAGLNARRNKVIIIMYEDIGSIDKLDLSLKAYLKTHSYLKYSDRKFWNKLRYAMPHKKRGQNVIMREIE